MARQLKEKVAKERAERERVHREYIERRKREAAEKHQRARDRLAKKRADRQAAVSAAYSTLQESERSGDYASMSRALKTLYETKGWDKKDYINHIANAVHSAKEVESRTKQYYTAWYDRLREELVETEPHMSEFENRAKMVGKIFELLNEAAHVANSPALNDLVHKTREMHDEQLQTSLRAATAAPDASLADLEPLYTVCTRLLQSAPECKIRDNVVLERCKALVRRRHMKEYTDNEDHVLAILRRVGEKDNILKMVDTHDLKEAVLKGEAILAATKECFYGSGEASGVHSDFERLVNQGRVELNRRLGLSHKCALCKTIVPRRMHEHEIKRIVDYLNKECARSPGDTWDKSVSISQLEHLYHMEGQDVDNMIRALKNVAAGISDTNSFADLVAGVDKKAKAHGVLSAVFRWKYILKRARRRKHGRLQTEITDAKEAEVDSKPPQADLFDNLDALGYLPEGYAARSLTEAQQTALQSAREEGLAVAAAATDSGQHHCGVCGVPMMPLRREQIMQVLEYFNTDECTLLVDKGEGADDEEEDITVTQVEHLFHQENSMTRTFHNLERLNNKGFSFTQFSEIVPAINKYLTTGLILRAVLKFHAILMRNRNRRQKKAAQKAEFEAKAVHCEICNFRMLPFPREDIMALLQYLNSEQCILFRSAQISEMKLSSKDLIHLLHQEGSLEGTLKLLHKLNEERLSFKDFAELVPYFHHRYVCVCVCVHVVFYFI
jgi:hypothetical protein